MVVKKPSIFIYTYQAAQDVRKEICAGIEEEGVFYEIMELKEPDVKQLAWQAAQDSILGSGVGISGADAAFTMRGLKAEKCVESYCQPSGEQSRKLGANCARAIKKLALKCDENREECI